MIDGKTAISFVELMELRVVRGLLEYGMTLQRIRGAAAVAATLFDTPHPFASRRWYTDGRRAFAEMEDDEGARNFLELSPGRVEQIISGHLVGPFLAEIDFDPKTSLAFRWWPLGKQIPVVLDPKLAFGAPTISPTAIRTVTVSRMAVATSMPETEAAFQLEHHQVASAIKFEELLAAAA